MPCKNHPGENEGLAICWRCRREFCRQCVVELQEYYFCADCKTAQVRDLLAGTDLINPDYAPLDRRLGAWFIDGFVKGSVAFALSFIGQIMATIVLSQSKDPFVAMLINVFFGLIGQGGALCYEALMLSKNKGQTLGKMAVGIRVVTADGNMISAGQAWWRAAFKVLLNFVTCTCCGMDALLDGAFALGAERAALHDLAAQTRVVNAE